MPKLVAGDDFTVFTRTEVEIKPKSALIMPDVSWNERDAENIDKLAWGKDEDDQVFVFSPANIEGEIRLGDEYFYVIRTERIVAWLED